MVIHQSQYLFLFSADFYRLVIFEQFHLVLQLLNLPVLGLDYIL